MEKELKKKEVRIMKVVFFQGSFDLINYGHIMAIKTARRNGDYLIIGLNTNKLYRKYKKRNPILPYWQKKVILENVKGVDKVIPMNTFSPLKELKELKVDVYIIGNEWTETKEKEIAFIKSRDGKIVITPRFSGVISTTKMKERLLKRG